MRVPKCAFCCRWREISSFESPQKSDGDTSFDQETTDPFQDETGKSATDPDVTRLSCDVSKMPDVAKSSDDASKTPIDPSKTPVGASKTPSDVSTSPGDVSSVPVDPASVVLRGPAALSHDTSLVKTEAPSIAAVTHPTEVAVVRETVPDEKTPDVTVHRPAEPSGVQQNDVDKKPPDVPVDATDQDTRQGKDTVTSPLGTTGDGAVLDVDKDASDGVSAADDAVTSSHVGAPPIVVSRPEPFVKLEEGVGSEDNPSEDEQVIIFYHDHLFTCSSVVRWGYLRCCD